MGDWARIDPIALDRWLTTPPEDDDDEAPHRDGCGCEECQPERYADVDDRCNGCGDVLAQGEAGYCAGCQQEIAEYAEYARLAAQE